MQLFCYTCCREGKGQVPANYLFQGVSICIEHVEKHNKVKEEIKEAMHKHLGR